MKHLPEKKVRDWKQERKRHFYRFLFSLQCLTRQTGPVRKTSKWLFLSTCPSVKPAALFSPQTQARDNRIVALRSVTAEIMQMPSPLPNQL